MIADIVLYMAFIVFLLERLWEHWQQNRKYCNLEARKSLEEDMLWELKKLNGGDNKAK